MANRADQIALTEYQLAVQAAQERVQRLTAALQQAVQGWRFEPIVACSWPSFVPSIKAVATALDVHCIADSYASHKHPKVRTWLAE